MPTSSKNKPNYTTQDEHIKYIMRYATVLKLNKIQLHLNLLLGKLLGERSEIRVVLGGIVPSAGI